MVPRPHRITICNAARTYGLMQLKVEALAMLRRAIDSGFSDIEWTSRDTDLPCLHDDPDLSISLE
jgi:hypothetical protein